MIGLGTIINVISIIIGSTIGLVLKHNLKDNYKNIMIQGVGLTTIVIGVTGAVGGFLDSNNKFLFLIIIISLVLGGVLGTLLKIQVRLNNIGIYVERKFAQENGFAKGFVTASLIFSVGAMAIMGAINDGMAGDISILAIKSILDGITSMILASTLGIGVLFSFVSVLVYQGLITTIAYFFKDFLPQVVINQMTIVGNILIIGIGLDLLELKKINIADMLPGIFLPIIYYLITLVF
ncbi:MAG: DUF554 domain-containing protein [Bacilli bacterium]|nr:DUF554 domain-containing protein [Bacilli bacterium]